MHLFMLSPCLFHVNVQQALEATLLTFLCNFQHSLDATLLAVSVSCDWDHALDATVLLEKPGIQLSKL